MISTGRTMPVIGVGTWQLTQDTAGTLEHALRLGYRLIDTSGDYGTQPGVGEALRRSEIDRGEVFVVTKVEEDEDAYEATRRNLRELGLEYADLMLVHRPPPEGVGVELWEGLIAARDEGLTRGIGVSNYSIEQIHALVDATGELPAVNQIEWSPFGWSREMLDYCRERGITIQAYCVFRPVGKSDLPDEIPTQAPSGTFATAASMEMYESPEPWTLELQCSQNSTASGVKAMRQRLVAQKVGALH